MMHGNGLRGDVAGKLLLCAPRVDASACGLRTTHALPTRV
jgi:hypothetical protein